MKTAVARACRYEPQLNAVFSEFATHHGFCAYEARPYHPKDKAKVEVAVLLAQRYLLASLRHTDFYDLANLNKKAHEMLETFNNKVMRRYGKSRRELFETLDKPNSIPRRTEPFAIMHITRETKVNASYHVEVLGNQYSVPHQYCGQSLYAKASGIGPQTYSFCKAIFEKENHLFRAERTVLGVLRIGKASGVEILEKACQFGIQFHCIGYGHLKRILSLRLYLQNPVSTDTIRPLPMHENVRGEAWFQEEVQP